MRPEGAFSPAARASDAPDPSRVLVIGCGALARELVAVIDQTGLTNVDLTCLPATLHNRPGGIPAAVRAKVRAARPRYERIFIAYADCGTGGLLDAMLADEGIERLPGAHCYEFFSGSGAFTAMMDEEPGTFFLTDFLARNFDRLVIVGLGLDRHPELLPTYFGNYRRLVYLAQTEDPGLVAAARRAARRLGLTFELRRTGYGDLARSVIRAAGGAGGAAGGVAGAGGGAVGVAGQPLVAAHATKTRVDSKPGLVSVDSLHGQQIAGSRRGSGARPLPPVQMASSLEARKTRNLRRGQRPGGTLPTVQHSGAGRGAAADFGAGADVEAATAPTRASTGVA